MSAQFTTSSMVPMAFSSAVVASRDSVLAEATDSELESLASTLSGIVSEIVGLQSRQKIWR